MAFHLIVSNSTQALAEHFRSRIYLKRGTEEMLTPEIAVVQSQGMSIWLNQQLADPIAANLETPFLNAFTDSVLEHFFSGEEKPLMTEEWMFWQIFHILMTESSHYPELHKYVSDLNSGLKACQLAEKIAALYDRYQIYHADLLAGWRMAPETEDSWQARLFRRISRHAAGRDERFSAFNRRHLTQEETEWLPKRITLFGISALAPVYFEFFQRLGTVSEVWFYYLNPSMEYWSDNQSRKEAARGAVRRGYVQLCRGENPDNLESGNPLLTSLGRQGRDFFRYLMSREEDSDGEQIFRHFISEVDGNDLQYQYSGGSMLEALQEDILLNIYRNPASDKNDPASGRPLENPCFRFDASLAIHSCHSELRQVEVLYDQLLALMEQEKLEPRDILVMAPDIGRFEPCIQAVFGGGESLLQNQYSIADRTQRSRNRCADTLLKVLRLMTGKFEVSAVLDLFEDPELAERWGVTGPDLDEIRSWIAKLGVHWGVNAADHEAQCGVRFEEYSWEQALDRLILGYAVAEDDVRQSGAPIIPFDSAEGKASSKTGNFVIFLQTLFDCRESLTTPHTLAEWCDLLDGLPEILFHSCTRNYKELSALRNTFAKIREQGKCLEGEAERIDSSLMMYLIEKNLVPTGETEPFLRGKITFCSMMPMRSIPMPVIALLGLDEQSFPRRDYTPGFNVVSSAGQRAALERPRNSEDRYIFLEVLLAARKHLLLFYQGRDKKTNQVRPPAVPLAELEDVLTATFPKLAGSWIAEHGLQAFDFRYFRRGSALFSYSGENYKAADALAESFHAAEFMDAVQDREAVYTSRYPGRIAGWAAGQEPETLRKATPYQLEKFFRNPSRFFLETAAGLRKSYEDFEPVPEDSEKISLDDLDRYRLRSLIFSQIQAGMTSEEDQYQLLRKTNQLPPGMTGKQDFAAEFAQIRQIPDSWLKHYIHSCGKPVSLTVNGLRIEGEISVSSEDGEPYVASRSSSIARDLIALWLRHLILCASGETVTSHFWNHKAGCCQHLEPLPTEQALARLEPLIGYFREGHFRPLPFFPNAGFAVTPSNKDWRKTSTFRNAFAGDGAGRTGDYGDPSVQLIFTANTLDPGSPFLDEFGQIASDVFGFSKGRGRQKELKKDE